MCIDASRIANKSKKYGISKTVTSFRSYASWGTRFAVVQTVNKSTISSFTDGPVKHDFQAGLWVSERVRRTPTRACAQPKGGIPGEWLWWTGTLSFTTTIHSVYQADTFSAIIKYVMFQNWKGWGKVWQGVVFEVRRNI